MIISLSRGYDDQGNPWIMCPLCFHTFPLISAREGGMLSTNADGTMSDACVSCVAAEYLYGANLMGA